MLLAAEAGLETGFHLGPFRVHDAVVHGVADAPALGDHVISKGAFFAGAPMRWMAARERSFRESVFSSTRMQPSVSKAWRSSRYFASVLMAVRCQSRATQVHPI